MTDWPVIGFIGLGTMGEPMALNLVKAGAPLVVWNRSPSKCRTLAEAGAAVAPDPSDVSARAEIVFLMLADASPIDVVLGRASRVLRSGTERAPHEAGDQRVPDGDGDGACRGGALRATLPAGPRAIRLRR